MGTYLEMQTAIADELVNESITTAQIKLAIQRSISSYQNTAFYFNQKEAVFNTVSGQENYSVTDLVDIPNITRFYSFNAKNSGVASPIIAKDYDYIDRLQTSLMTGFPYFYAYFAQKIRLYPIPNAVYICDIAYSYGLSTLSADSDTNAWVSNAEEMIRQGAKKRLALDILHSDDIAMRCSKLEKEAYDGLLQETKQRRPNMTLRYPSMLSSNSFNIYTGR